MSGFLLPHPSSTYKYLSQNCCFDLLWSSHVSPIVKNANSILAFFKRNVQISVHPSNVWLTDHVPTRKSSMLHELGIQTMLTLPGYLEQGGSFHSSLLERFIKRYNIKSSPCPTLLNVRRQLNRHRLFNNYFVNPATSISCISLTLKVYLLYSVILRKFIILDVITRIFLLRPNCER